MDKFLTNKKTNLIAFCITIGILSLIMLLGLGVVEEGDYHFWGKDVSVHYTLNMYGRFPFIFLVSASGTMLLYTPIIVLEFLGKINQKRAVRIVSIVLYSSVITLIFFFAFFGMIEYEWSGDLTFLGILLIVLAFITNLFLLFLLFLNIYQLAKMPKYYTKKQKEQIRKQQSVDAVQKLKQLKELLDLGAITQEEFEEKKKNYIDYL